MATELLTAYERKVLERDNRLAEQYAALRGKFPTASNNRLFQIMATKEKLTVMSIRSRLLKRGVIKKRNQTAAV